MREVKTKDNLMQLAKGWQDSVVFLTACRLDVFSYLKDYVSSEKLADILGVNGRYIDRLLNALVVLGLVEKSGGKYKNTSISDKYLDRNSDSYLLGLKHSAHMLYHWSFLFDVIKNGKPVKDLPYVKPVENWVEDFISAMQQYASERAPEFIGIIDFSGIKRVLDLGGGSGANAVEIARHYPEIEVVIFDLPEVIPISKRFVFKSGNFKNISFVEGDYFKNDIGEGFDAIIISQILHAHGKDEIVSILEKCHKALNQDGKIFIHDFLIDDDRTSPPWAVFFALNMLLHTENGDTYTEIELKDLLEKTGFTFISNNPTAKNSNVIVAKKG